MNNNKSSKQKNTMIAIYSTMGVVFAIAGITAIGSFTSNKEIEQSQNLAQNQVKVEQVEAVDKSDVKSYKENQTQQQTNVTQREVKEEKTETTTATTTKDEKSKEKPIEKETKEATFSLFDESQEMSWPVNGRIVMDYSVETALYDKTLDQYRTNDSICISAPVGSEVIASAQGVVEDVFFDEQKGNTVVINHGNGWLTTYSQLEESSDVAKGDVVDEGETIGLVSAPTNASVMLGEHLEFKITKEDLAQDPKLLLAQLEE